jgi:hypothetical protein
MTIVNLTPHALNIHASNGSVREVPPSGKVARVATRRVPGPSVDGIDTFAVEFGEVEDLPAPAADTVYVVSGMVAARINRTDVFAPGELVRDEKGQPCGCRGLSACGA